MIQEQPQKYPDWHILSGRPYTPADKTDVTKTWRRFGFAPKDQEHDEWLNHMRQVAHEGS